jgi:hypothetical protein
MILTKVTKFEMGTPGDGVMGTSLTQFNGIRKGTMTLTIPTPEQTNIETEESEGAWLVIPGARLMSFKLELVGVELADWNKFLGGTYDSPTKTLSFPTASSVIKQSVKITGQNENGVAQEIQVPLAQIMGAIDGALTKDDARGLVVTGNVLTPYTAAGVIQSPLLIKDLTA